MSEETPPITPVVEPQTQDAAEKTAPVKPNPAETVDIKSFIDLQKENAKLEKANKKLTADKDEVLRTSVLQELTRINKKLATAKKDESLATLTIILATAKELKGTFPELDNDPDPKTKKKEVAGYTLLGDKNRLGIE